MKVAVGLSGGVDSAVAAKLLLEQGHEVAGYTMALGRPGEERALAEARAVAASLGIRLAVCGFEDLWRREVADYLRETYRSGRTPNPCVRCNERVKFSALPRTAFADGFDMFATGHYARTGVGEDGRVWLRRAADRTKDQSYFLYRVDPDVLARTLFPLGGMTKTEVRAFARGAGIAVAQKGDSQDFCGGDVHALAGCGGRPGEICDVSGRVLARHDGIGRFTVGQRKGLGIGGGGTPWYVVAIDAAADRVVVDREEGAVRRSLEVKDARWLVPEPTDGAPRSVRVKIRSSGEPRGPATLHGTVCEFPQGLFGVAPGQSAVFYSEDGEEVLGGGIIKG